jgi:hypothetical protein
VLDIEVVVHNPQHDSALLWIQTQGRYRNCWVRVLDVGRNVIARWGTEASEPIRLPSPPNRERRVWKYQATGLAPGTPYECWAGQAGDERGKLYARFETLPTQLPGPDAERPFTVLMGSCFYAETDANAVPSSGGSGSGGGGSGGGRPDVIGHQRRVSQNQTLRSRYGHLYRSSNTRPHVKLLMGDQAYVDQPPSKFGGIDSPNLEDIADFLVNLPPIFGGYMNTEELEWHVDGVYDRSWRTFGSFLTDGANMMLTDDHEYWNDYPNKPVALWRMIHFGDSFRATMQRITRQYADGVQCAHPVRHFDIGQPAQLSFFVVDTRMNRSQGTARFIDETDMAALEQWLERLTSPGVLVIGQPLLTQPISRLHMAGKTFDTDINLPAYEQFPRLCRALTGCSHDVLVLSGDVHFGRVARINVQRTDGHRGPVLHEIVASPLSLLPGAGGRFDAHAAPIELLRFPPHNDSQHLDSGVLQTNVTYERLVPLTEKNECEDHFITLGFRDDVDQGHSVNVEVTAHLIRRPEGPGVPEKAWVYHCTLD